MFDLIIQNNCSVVNRMKGIKKNKTPPLGDALIFKLISVLTLRRMHFNTRLIVVVVTAFHFVLLLEFKAAAITILTKADACTAALTVVAILDSV